MADGGHFKIMQISRECNAIFGDSPSDIDNRSKTVVHAKFDAYITYVTIISLSN